ncbi:unnamed protein product [Citrullus colocynthis]|uniref:Uncharacterized protein n=1 Tax=Citrullus colocynthis TaxID=252529 RepID=A0ABP0YG86_9ROSI
MAMAFQNWLQNHNSFSKKLFHLLTLSLPLAFLLFCRLIRFHYLHAFLPLWTHRRRPSVPAKNKQSEVLKTAERRNNRVLARISVCTSLFIVADLSFVSLLCVLRQILFQPHLVGLVRYYSIRFGSAYSAQSSPTWFSSISLGSLV